MRQGHPRLSRAYKNVELSEKKHILIPVHTSNDHWFTIVIANYSNLVKIAKGQLLFEQLPAKERPGVLYFDSLTKQDTDYYELLKAFLEAEINSKLGALDKVKMEKSTEMRMSEEIIPGMDQEEQMEKESEFYFRITRENLPLHLLIVSVIIF